MKKISLTTVLICILSILMAQVPNFKVKDLQGAELIREIEVKQIGG